MIADSVEILTSHPDDEHARQLSLRSVHGRYLIRLLDKYGDQVHEDIVPHGTRIELKVRHSVDMTEIVEMAKRWVVVPHCDVSLTVDDNAPICIGFTSPKAAVENYVKDMGISVDDSGGKGNRRIKIVEEEKDGITLAYALEWSEYFREWDFLEPSEGEDREMLLGTCVEGIRVEFTSPGYGSNSVVALADAKGSGAPKTNVARSGLESTVERDKMLSVIYEIYCNNVRKEIEELHRERSFSLTWAVQESRYLLRPLVQMDSGAVNRTLLLDQVKKLPLLLIEHDGQRRAMSPSDFERQESFWTIDCASFHSAEALLREMPGNASLSVLVNAFESEAFQIPRQPLLCGRNEYFDSSGKEVVAIKVFPEHRRVDLQWGAMASPPRWRTIPLDDSSSPRSVRRLRINQLRGFFHSSLQIAQSNVPIEGITDEIAIRASGTTYLLPGSPITSRVNNWLADLRSTSDHEYRDFRITLLTMLLDGSIAPPVDIASLRGYAASLDSRVNDEILSPEFVDFINTTSWKIFDPSAWRRE
jgi:hypothetical protein